MLSGQLALVTGASQGIGKAIALKLAENGSDLVLTARSEQKLLELKEDIEGKFNVQVFIVCADLSDANSAKKIVSEIAKLKRPLDILVNNAGLLKSSMISMVSKADIDEQFNVNVFSLIQLCQLASRLMIRNKSGSIINLSSIMGTEGASGVSVYSATKAAILGFTKSLSKELAPYNIRVNCVSPGFIDTDMTVSLDASNYDKRVESIGFKKPGSANDVANAVLFLSSDMSAYITGQNLGVDGGMIL